MSIELWTVFAFLAGLGAVVAYYKHSRWIGLAIAIALPVVLIGILGWPRDQDFRDTTTVSIISWVVAAFIGSAVATAAVVLRIVR